MAEAWPKIVVLGAGAVGCYFGGMLARAGAPVTLIGRARHVEAIRRDGLFLESLHFQERVAVAAVTEAEAARAAEIVLFCVKTLDTESAALALAPHLASGATVISLQNGVDNADRIRAVTGIEALPCVVYVAASMPAPGHVKHVGRGDLVLGGRPDMAAMFERAGVPCRLSADLAADLWTKLVMNCAYNAISALCRCNYGQAAVHSLTRALIAEATEEVIAVAVAAGVRLPDGLVAAAWKLGAEAMPAAVSSTAQDIARGSRTEIDSLNGYVARRGAELGVPAPVNRTLHALVKLLEEPH